MVDAPDTAAGGASGGAETLEATVRRTVYSSDESGWAVVRVEVEGGGRTTATGPLLGVRDGDRLRLSGRWVDHPRFGPQFEVASFLQLLPTTRDGIRRFLASGRIRGIGPKTAERLVDAFGLATFDILDREPGRLVEVRGIGAATARRITSSWSEQRAHREVLVFLASHGVTPGLALRVARRYGASALETVRANPYRLAEEVAGIGFLTADRIARGLGVPADAPERLEAGLLHVLSRAAEDGHTVLPEAQLATTARAALDTEAELGDAVGRLAARRAVAVRAQPDGDRQVALAALDGAEERIAAGLRRLLAARGGTPTVDAARALDWHDRRSGLRLAASQRRAVELALGPGVAVVTGGPGTGKTTLVRALVDILERRGDRVELAAPTGRAAKRLAEATGRPARTVHRLLEFAPATATFARGSDLPLDADLVVVDEASMLDVELAASLLEAVPSGCRLLLVGDADQLPSVGPGNVLGDVIGSGAVPTVRLNRIFRQAEASRIVLNAHRIQAGEMPLLEHEPSGGDFYFIARDDPETAASTVVELVTRRIPDRFSLHPVRDIQVLTPMHRGPLGVAAINRRLQEVLAPPGDEVAVGDRRFRAGDKVMQVRNNYELDVFNGDLGLVERVDRDARELLVRFDDRLLLLGDEQLDDLVNAYACTVHKAQGSEYPAVVLVLHRHHHVMLERHLLYTAVTRARRLLVLVGSRGAVWRSVQTAGGRRRLTTLVERLAPEPGP